MAGVAENYNFYCEQFNFHEPALALDGMPVQTATPSFTQGGEADALHTDVDRWELLRSDSGETVGVRYTRTISGGRVTNSVLSREFLGTLAWLGAQGGNLFLLWDSLVLANRITLNRDLDLAFTLGGFRVEREHVCLDDSPEQESVWPYPYWGDVNVIFTIRPAN